MRTALARIDSFPYRHRLRDLMNSPPLFVESNISLRDALAALIDHEVSSLYVHPLVEGDKAGIVTERDLLRKFREKGDAAFNLAVGDIAIYPLASLSADAFVYRAIARMKRMHVRHLGVHDNHGEIIGALSARDLLRQGLEDQELVLPHQAILEFVAATTRPRADFGGEPLLARSVAYREAESLVRDFTILFPDEDVLITALRAVSGLGLSWYDAHLWAYAEVNGLPEILSEDFEHGRHYGHVRVVDPFLVAEDEVHELPPLYATTEL